MKRKFFYLFVALLMITMPNVYAQESVPKGAKLISEEYVGGTTFLTPFSDNHTSYNWVCPGVMHQNYHIIGGESADKPLRIYFDGTVTGDDKHGDPTALFVVMGGYVEFIGVNNGTLKNSRSNTIVCTNSQDKNSDYSTEISEGDISITPKDYIGDTHITIRNLTIEKREGLNNTTNTLYFGSHNGYTATFDLTNVTIQNFESGGYKLGSGAVGITDGVTCTFTNCTFKDNNVLSNNKTCGGVYVLKGTATFNNCTFTNNRGSDGGAIKIAANGHVTLNNCTITNNKGYSNSYTGAVSLANGGSLTLKGTTTITNQTIGGNIYLATGAKFTPASDWTGTAGVTAEDKPMAATPTRQITTNGSPKPEFGTITSDNNNLLVKYVSGATPYHQLLVPTIGQDMDNTEIIKYLNGHENVSINLDRTIQTGGYNTICLPFDVSESMLKKKFGEKVALKELASSTYENEVLTLHLKDATNIVAGKPYLIYVEATKSLNPGFDGVTWMSFSSDEPTLTTTETKYCNFVPVYNSTHLENDNKNILFLVGNNQLCWPDSRKYKADMRGLRAYFVVKDPAAQEARTFVLSFDDQTTAIVSLRQDSKELDTNAPMYDLLGQQVSSSYRGIVIQNGKKFVVK